MQVLFLTVEEGEPYSAGTIVRLQAEEVLLGRSWEHHTPDISFNNLYISRKHALVKFTDNQFFIIDLASKHGTQVNGTDLEPNRSYVLRHGDKIALAKGAAVLIFHNPAELDAGETVELSGAFPVYTKIQDNSLTINSHRREISINGSPVNLFGKDLELLLLLYQNRGQAVSYGDIKTKIWPERPVDFTINAPDVGNDEITALVYRLRRKLGSSGNKIVSIPKYGYMLDV